MLGEPGRHYVGMRSAVDTKQSRRICRTSFKSDGPGNQLLPLALLGVPEFGHQDVHVVGTPWLSRAASPMVVRAWGELSDSLSLF